MQVKDYFENDVAADAAQAYVDDIRDEFHRVLEFLGLKESRSSEWSYGCQCRGTVVQPDLGQYNDCSILSVEPVDPAEIPDDFLNFREVYERFQPRMRDMFEWILRTKEHLSGAPDCYRPYEGLGLCWDYLKRRDRVRSVRMDAMLDEYTVLIERLCEALASKVDELYEQECDYAYSDEAAREWAEGCAA